MCVPLPVKEDPGSQHFGYYKNAVIINSAEHFLKSLSLTFWTFNFSFQNLLPPPFYPALGKANICLFIILMSSCFLVTK